MDKNAIKRFAVWARRDLIERVAQKAAGYGITTDEIIPADADSIHGELLSDAVKRQRKALITEINEKGYEQVIEEVAYTWFNRLIALRFMEVNGYLPSHIRVFTNDDGAFQPQILSEAINLDPADWDGIDMERIYALKQDNKDEELFKYLLILQCNALNAVLPKMFEKIEHYTELLLPDYLLREGSVIEQMIALIPEDDWREQVQIIGWLYQYYNSEKKDAVFEAMKKNVKVSKDNIPAATQLFTPDWIVRYMVENSLGRLWVDGHADTSARAEWKYYLDEAEQTPEVQAQLAEIRAGRKDLTPEQIRFIDPCMGSGHILVYAFDVLMQIYVSCGYSERDAAQSIVQHNLWGLDLDKRAYQLAYFALMMKARQYDRRFLTRGIKPNLSHFQDLPQLNYTLLDEPIRSFVQQFENADTYGSLISVQAQDGIDEALDSFTPTLELGFMQMEHFMQLYKILSQRYDVVCTNPPYMGAGNMNGILVDYLKKQYPDSKSDLSTAFMEKCNYLTSDLGYYAMINIPVWMFLSSYEILRKKIVVDNSYSSMLHFGRGVFGSDFGTTAFVVSKKHIPHYMAVYRRLFEKQGAVDSVEQKEKWFFEGMGYYTSLQENYAIIPGVPVAYWISKSWVDNFTNYPTLRETYTMKKGTSTGNNAYFIRSWYEIGFNNLCLNAHNPGDAIQSRMKWFPINTGGERKKWYGNRSDVVNWFNDGEEMKATVTKLNHGSHWSRYIVSPDRFFTENATWSAISSSRIAVRYSGYGFAFSSAAMEVFGEDIKYIMALINSKVGDDILQLLAPTINFGVEQVGRIPIMMTPMNKKTVETLTDNNIHIAQEDWDSFETSWDFKRHPLI